MMTMIDVLRLLTRHYGRLIREVIAAYVRPVGTSHVIVARARGRKVSP